MRRTVRSLNQKVQTFITIAIAKNAAADAACSTCGNGTCEGVKGEWCKTCPNDCGTCCGNGYFCPASHPQCCGSFCYPSDATCGDGTKDIIRAGGATGTASAAPGMSATPSDSMRW